MFVAVTEQGLPWEPAEVTELTEVQGCLGQKGFLVWSKGAAKDQFPQSSLRDNTT